MGLPRVARVFACLLAAGVALGGCGGSGSGGGGALASRPAPPPSEFPSAAGKSLRDLLKAAKGHTTWFVSPAAMVFHPGVNRYPFEISEKSRRLVTGAKVALYYTKAAGKPGTKPIDHPAIGPVPAAIESLGTKPQFRAASTASDPNAARSVYVANLDFSGTGKWSILALIKQGSKLKVSLLPGPNVGGLKAVPKVGQRAPLIHTPTAADVHGRLGKITTRVPPDRMNQVDYAEVLGKKPIALLFATPEFCQSRVCGPVVDVAEQVNHTYGDRVAFVHMEIYNNNDPSNGVRPQVRAFHLPSEPWLFMIDRKGTIRSEIEGPFGVEALTRVVKGVTGE